MQTGELLFEIEEEFPGPEAVTRLVTRICDTTPSGKKSAILMDRTNSHKALTVKAEMERLDVTACFTRAYHR